MENVLLLNLLEQEWDVDTNDTATIAFPVKQSISAVSNIMGGFATGNSSTAAVGTIQDTTSYSTADTTIYSMDKKFCEVFKFVLVGVILPSLCVLCCVGNFLAFLILTRKPRTITKILLISLAICDVVLGLFVSCLC